MSETAPGTRPIEPNEVAHFVFHALDSISNRQLGFTGSDIDAPFMLLAEQHHKRISDSVSDLLTESDGAITAATRAIKDDPSIIITTDARSRVEGALPTGNGSDSPRRDHRFFAEFTVPTEPPVHFRVISSREKAAVAPAATRAAEVSISIGSGKRLSVSSTHQMLKRGSDPVYSSKLAYVVLQDTPWAAVTPLPSGMRRQSTGAVTVATDTSRSPIEYVVLYPESALREIVLPTGLSSLHILDHIHLSLKRSREIVRNFRQATRIAQVAGRLIDAGW